MSRRIDVSKQLSEDDLAYLRARDRHRELDEYAMSQMGGGVPEATPENKPKSGVDETATEAKADAETDSAEAEPDKPSRRRRKS